MRRCFILEEKISRIYAGCGVSQTPKYYDKMKGCLLHELAHAFGAPDHYDEKDADGNCLHSEYCIECNPETGRPKFCIMCEGWPEDITTRNPHQLFCEGCIQDMKNHLESLK